jgi:hypothetical protein
LDNRGTSVRSMARVKACFLLHILRTLYEAPPSPFSTKRGGSVLGGGGLSGWYVRLDIADLLVPKLRMCGAMPPLPPRRLIKSTDNLAWF